MTQEAKTLPKNLQNPETANKWESQKGRLANPVFQAQALAARKAKADAAFRDPQKYLKQLFNQPKRGGSSIKVTCTAIEAATRRLSEYLINNAFEDENGKMNIKEYLQVLDNLKKTISFLDDLNSESAGRAINNWMKIDQITVNGSKTGGVVGSILDVEPTKLSELTSNGPKQN